MAIGRLGSGIRGGDGIGGGVGWSGNKASASRGSARVKVHYEALLPDLSLWDVENSWTQLTRAVFPTIHCYVICKNFHLCGLFWEEFEHKNSHVPTSMDVAYTITGLMKTALGGLCDCLHPSGISPSSPLKLPSSLSLTSKGKSRWKSDVME